MIKIIAIDLDGTLLSTEKNISNFALDVLKSYRQCGVKIVVVTARSEIAAIEFVKKIAPDVAIYNNGALAKNNEEIIFEEQISANICQNMLRTCSEKYNLTNTKVVTCHGDFSNAKKRQGNNYEYIYSDYKFFKDKAYKITIKSDQSVAQQLACQYQNCHMIKFEDRNSYMFTSLNATKEIAIKKIANYFKISMNEVIAFGDDLADLALLSECGIGVAVANANPKVIETADFVCESNDNEGVAKWLNSHIDLLLK